MRVFYGCSDGNCVIRRPVGQHTNGGCGCLKSLRYQDGQKEFREGMAALHAVVEAAEAMLPFIHEHKMEGETEYERAVLALEAAIQKVKATSTERR